MEGETVEVAASEVEVEKAAVEVKEQPQKLI